MATRTILTGTICTRCFIARSITGHCAQCDDSVMGTQDTEVLAGIFPAERQPEYVLVRETCGVCEKVWVHGSEVICRGCEVTLAA